MNCPFCDKENDVVFESEHTRVILDKYPLVYGHTLIIPKRHVVSLNDLSDAEMLDLMKVLGRTQHALMEAVKSKGSDIRENYRPFLPESEFSVRHIHFHILPRNKDDELFRKLYIHQEGMRKNFSREQQEALRTAVQKCL